MILGSHGLTRISLVFSGIFSIVIAYGLSSVSAPLPFVVYLFIGAFVIMLGWQFYFAFQTWVIAVTPTELRMENGLGKRISRLPEEFHGITTSQLGTRRGRGYAQYYQVELTDGSIYPFYGPGGIENERPSLDSLIASSENLTQQVLKIIKRE